MTTGDRIDWRASELLEAARRFRSAAENEGCHVAAPAALESLEETLQVLSAAWYQLAADAAPRSSDRRLAPSLHDVAAGFARCARVCREARSVTTPIVDRPTAAARETERAA